MLKKSYNSENSSGQEGTITKKDIIDELNPENVDLIKSISKALTIILEENKQSDNYKDIIEKQNKMIFSSKTIPNISIYDYLIRIQFYSGIEKSTLIFSLILIDHICKNADLILTYYNIHRILFGSILISIKINEDSIYDNKFYAEIAGVKLKELNVIEYTFFKLNNFNVLVSTKEYKKYKNYLESFNKITEK